MGFGSYDESEQDKREINTDFDEDENFRTDEHVHDGAIEYTYGESNEKLLSQLEQIKERED